MTSPELTKENIDWANLAFIGPLSIASWRLQRWRWSEGELTTNQMVSVHEGSTFQHYGQQCFEGMKAQTAKDGRVLLFAQT